MAVARLPTSLARGRVNAFDSVKTFSKTLAAQRSELGEVVTSWLQARPDIEIADIVVTQSSDSEYHCLTITVFFTDAPKR